MIMQLQYLSKSTGENLGGLYVVATEIACVEHPGKTIRFESDKDGYSNHRVVITLKNGKEYLIPWGMMDFLDEWTEQLGLRKKG